MTRLSLPSQRPIAWSDCPAFQRLHISARCVEDSFHRFCIRYTTLGKKIYIRWCCIDQLSPHRLPGLAQLLPSCRLLRTYVGFLQSAFRAYPEPDFADLL